MSLRARYERGNLVALLIRQARDEVASLTLAMTSFLLHNRQNYLRLILININRFLYKILIFCVVNINKLLWIAVGKWEPTALYLHHNTVAFFKRMGNIGQGIFYLRGFVGHECFRV